MNVGTSFIAHAQSPEVVQPRQGALNHPARFSKAAAVCGTAFGEVRPNAHLPQGFSVGFGIVASIGLKAIGTMTRSSALAAYRRNRLHQGQQLRHIVGVRTRHREGQGDALRVREDMMFAPKFAPIRWIWPRFVPPKTARTDALSATVRDQSITSASFKYANKDSKISCHTPACCQACRRRQQVMPLPHPISWGRYSHGIPVRKTNRMPVNACRFGTLGRPLLLGGLSGGRMGSMSSQRLSGKIGRAITLLLCSPILGFGRRHPRCAEHVMKYNQHLVKYFC